MTDRPRLVITDDDVQAPPPAAAPPAYSAQAPLPSVHGVRPQPLQVGGKPAAYASPLSGTIAQTLIASVLGAFAGWGATELFVGEPEIGHLVRYTAEFFAVFGAAYAAVFAAWESLRAGIWEAALRSAVIGAVVGAIGGAVSGAIAQELYAKILEDIVRSGTLTSATDFKLNAARALGWAILGVGIGAALGAAKRSSRKLVNGLIGGAIGGAIGGYLFNYVAEASGSISTTRLVTTAIAGVAIGIAIGLVEVARRQAWLRVTGGGMTGKEFILYHAVTNVGSSPKAEITLIKDPAIAPFHLRIDDRGNSRVLTVQDGMPAAVNGEPVASRQLRRGDSIQIGNTTLAYQEKELVR